MSRSRQIAINAVSQWGVSILSAALGLVLVPFLIAKLGREGYGLIAVTMAIAGVCTLADFGISGALGRQLAEALAKKNDSKYRELLSTALGLNLVVGLPCAVAVFLLTPSLARLFALPDSLFDTGVFLLRTYGAAHVLFTFLMPAPKAVLASHNRFDISSHIDALRRLFETAGLFLVLASTGAGIAGWAVVCVATDVVCTALLWRAALKTHVNLRVGFSEVRFSSVKDLLALGSQFTLLQVSSQLSVNADPFILTTCLGPASVSLYRPPSHVFSAVSPLVSTLGTQLNPLATHAHVVGDKEGLAAILCRGTKYTMLIAVIFIAVLISLAYPLCKVWLGGALGAQYTTCAAVLTIQAITHLFAFAAGTQWTVLLAIRRTAFAAYGRLTLSLLNIFTSWLLVRYTTLGVIGVVIPTMAIEIIWRPALAYYVCRAIGVSPLRYLREAYMLPSLIGGIVIGVGFTVRLLVAPDQLWSVAATAVVLLLIGAILTWFRAFNLTERTGMLHVARSLVPLGHMAQS